MQNEDSWKQNNLHAVVTPAEVVDETGFSFDEYHQFLPLKPAVLMILVALAEESRHGYAIMVAVREHSVGNIKLGTGHLYRHLKKLLEARWVQEVAGPSAEEDARRRYYCLTLLGRRILAAEAARLANLVEHTRHLGLLGESGGVSG